MDGALSREAIEQRIKALGGWRAAESGTSIEKTYEFKDFAGALAFVNAVGELAEDANHHPDIEFGWGRARIALSTHDVGGVSEKDIALATRIERIAR